MRGAKLGPDGSRITRSPFGKPEYPSVRQTSCIGFGRRAAGNERAIQGIDVNAYVASFSLRDAARSEPAEFSHSNDSISIGAGVSCIEGSDASNAYLCE